MLPVSTSSRRGTPQKSEQGRRVPFTRSKSFLGVIKDLVTAPLTWFAETEDDSGDVNGKRRRLVQSDARVDAAESGTPNKRQRVGGPDRQVGSGYLDPPQRLLQQSGDSRLSQSQSSSPSHLPYRSSSVFTHSSTIQRPPHDRHSISPLATTSESRPLGMTRTMSTDLSTRHGLVQDVTMISVSREPSMHASFTRDSTSVRRDVSVPVARTPFRMRTSLTPQLSTSHFGPTVKHKERDPSEPPPLTSLMSQPIFVKAPRDTPEPRAMSVQPVVTLGSVVDSQRSVCPMVVATMPAALTLSLYQSHVRQHSSLFGSQPDPPPHLPNGEYIITVFNARVKLRQVTTPSIPRRKHSTS
jgi:nucleoporin NUP1